MAGSSADNRKLYMRILLGFVVLALAGSMLLYLVPQGPSQAEIGSTDTVARVGDETISVAEVRNQLDQIKQRSQVPPMLEPYYEQQILSELVLQKEMEYEAKQLGIRVSNEEIADRIRLVLPDAFKGDIPLGGDQYAALVQGRTQMTVPQFEDAIRQELLKEKFQKLVTDGISAGPAELQQEFLYRNEKVKLDYVFIKPEDLQSKITLDNTEIKSYFEKNKTKYQVPEKRLVRYAVVDVNLIRQNLQIPDAQLKVLYQNNIKQYEVPNRAHIQQIFFGTAEKKTDAEIEEVRKKAEDVLKQVKKGGKFDELAKKYSEDPTSKDKGGDLGWIEQGRTGAEFEKAAFGLPPGSISDVIKTPYGFHIIKVLERETAHTKPFEEVKDSIRAPLLLSGADKRASDIADNLSRAIRQSSNVSLDDVAKQFQLTVSETRPVAQTDAVLELGNSQEVKDAIFRARPGEVTLPLHTDRGYVILAVKQIFPAHQGSLEEVRDRLTTDLKQEKASEQARIKADELAKRGKAGENFDTAAKALGLEAKLSDDIARDGTISGVASGKQLAAAFHLKPGDLGTPLNLGANWVVYKVVSKQEPKPDDFEKQKKDLTDQVLQSKKSLAFQAFRTALEDRLKREGKFQEMPEKLRTIGNI